ncbi:hypothetical protein LDENG_00076340 [Lucifuga dentata]|nr:hypothetical protein LDENG_00076340 [Lucifuga dentata]
MELFFLTMFYGRKCEKIARHISDVSIRSVLLVMAKYIKYFCINSTPNYLQTLSAEKWPLLSILEKSVRTVELLCSVSFKRKLFYELYILHRLLDHGEAKELIIDARRPNMVAWLLHARGSQYINQHVMKLMRETIVSCISNVAAAGAAASDSPEAASAEEEEDLATPRKRLKLDSVSEEEKSATSKFPDDLQALCQTVSPSAVAEACPRGRIHSLHMKDCGPESLRVLIPYLPTWLCLHSLTLRTSLSAFRVSDVLDLAGSIQQLSESSSSRLTHLSLGLLPNIELLEALLDASPSLRSLTVEIHPMAEDLGPHRTRTAESAGMSELPLEKLSVKVAQLQTDLHSVLRALRRSSRLASLHIAGMRPPHGSSHSQLLSTLSESNRCLKQLHLEDLNLSSCLPDILNLLRHCMLEELWLKDCRLLEKSSNREESLQQLVAALQSVSSLRSLSLAQNRLATSVAVLAELFSGSSASAVTRLDLSSNFIQAAELLQFGQRMETHRPPHRVTLDLRKNPWDRDAKLWNTAVERLNPVCDLLMDGWTSRDTMADHISNM